MIGFGKDGIRDGMGCMGCGRVGDRGALVGVGRDYGIRVGWGTRWGAGMG